MNNIPTGLATCSGRFYEGMRASEAVKNGTYNNFIARDFVNVDKNKNGILERNEIVKERKFEVKLSLFTAILSFIVSGMACSLKNKNIIDYATICGCLGLGTMYSLATYCMYDENKKLLGNNLRQNK